jgi:hypothetical protein
MSWEASENPETRPVSCWGKRPFGTMTARKTVERRDGQEQHEGRVEPAERRSAAARHPVGQA